MERCPAMAIRYLLIALLGVCAGAAFVLVYDRFNFEHVERRNAAQADDRDYQEARQALELDKSEFVRAFGENISAIKIDGVGRKCYFFYKTSGMIYDGEDIMYCFDKETGTFLGQA